MKCVCGGYIHNINSSHGTFHSWADNIFNVRLKVLEKEILVHGSRAYLGLLRN